MLIREVLGQKGSEIVRIGVELNTLDAVDLLNRKRIGSLIVVNSDGSVAGILSERDLLTHFRESVKGIPVTKIMTPVEKLIIIHAVDTVDYAMTVMTEHRIRHLPVFEGEQMIGLISIGDVIKALSSQHEFETKILNDYIAGSQAFVS